MYWLADFLFHGTDMPVDKPRALQLWQTAAELGHANCQAERGTHCCVDGSLEQIQWWRRAAIQGCDLALRALLRSAEQHLFMFRATGSGRYVYELGMAFHVQKRWLQENAPAEAEAAHLTGEFYDLWCKDAKRAVLCWIWMAKLELRVGKDVRIMIADMIWVDRVVWSDENTKVSFV